LGWWSKSQRNAFLTDFVPLGMTIDLRMSGITTPVRWNNTVTQAE